MLTRFSKSIQLIRDAAFRDQLMQRVVSKQGISITLNYSFRPQSCWRKASFLCFCFDSVVSELSERKSVGVKHIWYFIALFPYNLTLQLFKSNAHVIEGENKHKSTAVVQLH